LSSNPARGLEKKSTAARKSRGTKTVRRRRTKGPSEKIRSLAALSLSAKVGYLKLDDLLGGASSKVEALIDGLPKRNFKKGDKVYPSSVKGPVLFLIKSGSVAITRASVTGQEFDVKTLEPGAIFGDMPLAGQAMLGAQAVATEPTKVALINNAEFEKLAAASPSIALNVVRQLGPRLVEAERKHEQAAFQPVTSRISALLLKLANKEGDVMGHTHQEMADMLGVYRETVTNAIAELKADGLIKVGRKKIRILNREGVQKLEAL
jgi:CRP/FNR family transcriptional regulator, cyclic AMP receptor protein